MDAAGVVYAEGVEDAVGVADAVDAADVDVQAEIRCCFLLPLTAPYPLPEDTEVAAVACTAAHAPGAADVAGAVGVADAGDAAGVEDRLSAVEHQAYTRRGAGCSCSTCSPSAP